MTTEYYILAWLFFYYALLVLSALVGFWIRNKYYLENEKITQIEYGIVSEKPILCKMIASNEENKHASEIIIWFYALYQRFFCQPQGNQINISKPYNSLLL